MRRPTMSDDLDRRIAEGLEPAASYMPRTAELLPEFRRRLVRRRRRTTAGAALALVLLLGVGVLVVGREDAPRRAVTAGSTTSTSAPPTVTASGLEIGPALEPGDVELPAEGVAVEVADVGVVLVGVDGQVYGHLPGMEIVTDEDTAGPLVLRRRTETLGEEPLFVLGGGRVRATVRTGLRFFLPLSYGGQLGLSLGDPPDMTVQRDGKEVFELGSTMVMTARVSNDRDVVSRDAWNIGTNQAFDLRTGKVHDVQAGCWVADRHGPRWYLLCWDGEEQTFVAAGERTDSASALPGGEPPDGEGHWRKAMASPDGRQLLMQWSGGCATEELFTVASAGGDRTPLFDASGGVTADAYGWTADGRPVVFVRGERCGSGVSAPKPGIYVLGPGDSLVYDVPVPDNV